MKKRHFITIHPFDPWGSKIGGIETVIRAMFQHTPENVRHTLIGVSEDPQTRPLQQWRSLNYKNKHIQFLPIMADKSPNQRSLIPLFLRFSIQMRFITLPLDADLILFHRVEPAFSTPIKNARSTLFIHGNPLEITGPRSEVKWKHIPGLYKRVEKHAVTRCDRVQVVSQSGVKHLQSQYPQQAHKFIFQSTGFDESVFHPQQDDDAEIPFTYNRATKYVLFAGRLEEQKNPLLALASFFELRKQMNHVKLLIAGEGSLLPQMKAACSASQYNTEVIFLGRLTSPTLAAVMRKCDVFLMTSRFEGMPIAALEALACGLPVVSTNAGEARFFIQDGINGYITKNVEPTTISCAVMDMLKHGMSHEKIAESVHLFRNTHVMDNLYQKLIALSNKS